MFDASMVYNVRRHKNACKNSGPFTVFLNLLLNSIMFLKPILIQGVFLAICVAIIIVDVFLVVYNLFSLVILPFASTCHEDHTVICVIFGYVEFHARYKKSIPILRLLLFVPRRKDALFGTS